jgi:hypothetical protein
VNAIAAKIMKTHQQPTGGGFAVAVAMDSFLRQKRKKNAILRSKELGLRRRLVKGWFVLFLTLIEHRVGITVRGAEDGDKITQGEERNQMRSLWLCRLFH